MWQQRSESDQHFKAKTCFARHLADGNVVKLHRRCFICRKTTLQEYCFEPSQVKVACEVLLSEGGFGDVVVTHLATDKRLITFEINGVQRDAAA